MTKKLPKVDAQDQHFLSQDWRWGDNGWYFSTRANTRYLHREILGVSGDSDIMVRFKNGDKSDCRRQNLESVSMGFHARQTKKKIKGYTYKPGRSNPYEARIAHQGTNYFLGTFSSEEAASQAYEKALGRIALGLSPKSDS